MHFIMIKTVLHICQQLLFSLSTTSLLLQVIFLLLFRGFLFLKKQDSVAAALVILTGPVLINLPRSILVYIPWLTVGRFRFWLSAQQYGKGNSQSHSYFSTLLNLLYIALLSCRHIESKTGYLHICLHTKKVKTRITESQGREESSKYLLVKCPLNMILTEGMIFESIFIQEPSITQNTKKKVEGFAY